MKTSRPLEVNNSFDLFYNPLLCEDLASQICPLLSFKDLLSIDATAKDSYKITEKTWKHLQTHRYFNYNFMGVASGKDSYLLCRAIEDYILLDRATDNREFTYDPDDEQSDYAEHRMEEAIRIYKRFAGLMERFPKFGSMVCFDLKVQGPEFEDTQEYKKFEAFIPQLEYAIKEPEFSEQEGGDFLLQGLHSINRWRFNENDTTFSKIYQCFYKAIQKKATCAPLYAHALGYHYVATKDFQPHAQDWLLPLGLLSECQNDYRAVNAILEGQKGQAELFQLRGNASPAVMFTFGKETLKDFLQFKDPNVLVRAESLVDEAIALFDKEFTPFEVFMIASCIKSELKKDKEAKYFYEMGLNGLKAIAISHGYDEDSLMELTDGNIGIENGKISYYL